MRRRSRSHRRGKNHTVRNIVIGCFVITLLFTTGYGAFQTVISINAKGNIKDLKQEVDSKVPTNDLLFWGQADNSENTLTILKDKSSHANDGVLNNFDNTSSSGFYNDELIFDGINDYVDIGYANYDFHNSQTMIMYFKLNTIRYQALFGNWGNAGGGLLLDQNYYFAMRTFCEGKGYVNSIHENPVNTNDYYNLIGVLDGNTSKVYLNGKLVSTVEQDNYKNSTEKIFIGGDPQNDVGGSIDNPSNISLLEVMLYDRALTEDEVKTITDGFNRKYKKNTTN